MELWLKYYQHSAIGSVSAFQKTFHNLTNDQIIQLKNKFQCLHDGRALSFEFAASIALSNCIQRIAKGYNQIEDEEFIKVLKTIHDSENIDEGIVLRVRQLLAVFKEMDCYFQQTIDWSQFSHTVQTSQQLQASELTVYTGHQQFFQLLPTKTADPIQSVWFSPHSACFMFCVKDNAVHQMATDGIVVQKLKGGHASLPMAVCSFRPPVAENLSQMKPNAGTFLYLTTGIDRRMCLWLNSGVMIQQIQTENVQMVIAAQDQIVYKSKQVKPAVFTGDDSGNIHFLRFENTYFGDIEYQRQFSVLGEEEINQFEDDKFVDEVSAGETSAESALSKQNGIWLRQQAEMLQKSSQAAAITKLSATFMYSIKAHTGAVTCILLEHMMNQDRTLLASGGQDGMIYVHNISNGTRSTCYRGHKAAVTGLAWLHQRGLMLSVGRDCLLNVWAPGSPDVVEEDQKPVATLVLDQPLIGVFASRTIQEFVVVDVQGVVRQFDVRRLECVSTIIGNSGSYGKAFGAAYDTVGSNIAVASSVYGLAKPQNQNMTMQVSQSAVQKISVSQLNPGIVIATGNTIQTWDMLRCRQMGKFEKIFEDIEQKGTIGNVTGAIDNSEALGTNVLKNMDNIFSSDKYGMVLLNTKLPCELPQVKKVGQGEIYIDKQATALALSPNSQVFAVATEDERIALFQIQNGELVLEIQGKESKQNLVKYQKHYDEMDRQKVLQNRIQQELKYSTEPIQKIGHQVSRQRFGVATDLFFGISRNLTLWVCFQNQKLIQTYSIVNHETFHLLGKYSTRSKWTQVLFLEQQNRMLILTDNEIQVIEEDGLFVLRATFQQNVKQIQLILQTLVVYLYNGQVIFLDSASMNIICVANVPAIQTSISAQFCTSTETLLILDENGSIGTYKLQDTVKIVQAYNALVVHHGVIDLHVGLQISQKDYTCQYQSRRQYLQYAEIPQNYRKECDLKPATDPITQRFLNREILDIQVTETQERMLMVHEFNLQELCPLFVLFQRTSQLFMVSTALGHVLVFDAQGRFMQFLSQCGWEPQNRTKVCTGVKGAPPTFQASVVSTKLAADETKCFEYLKLISGEVLAMMGEQTSELVLLPLMQKERDNIKAIANTLLADKLEHNNKLNECQSKIKRQDTKGATFIQDNFAKTQRLMKAITQQSPSRTDVTKVNARDVMANALIQSSKLMVTKGRKTSLSPIQKKSSFYQKTEVEDNLQKPKVIPPTLLNMDPEDIRIKYGARHFKASSVMKTHNRFKWTRGPTDDMDVGAVVDLEHVEHVE